MPDRRAFEGPFRIEDNRHVIRRTDDATPYVFNAVAGDPHDQLLAVVIPYDAEGRAWGGDASKFRSECSFALRVFQARSS